MCYFCCLTIEITLDLFGRAILYWSNQFSEPCPSLCLLGKSEEGQLNSVTVHSYVLVLNHSTCNVEIEKYPVTGLWSHTREPINSLSLAHSSLLNHHIISWQKLRG